MIEPLKQPRNYRIVPIGKSVFTMVDILDYDWVERRAWRLSPDGFAVASDSSKLEDEVVRQSTGGLKSHGTVEHINGDLLDNRRANLHVA